jgi:hypothetical protein
LLHSFRKRAAMQHCYSCKRATDQTKVRFHLSTPVGIAFTANSFSKRVAAPVTIPARTNSNFSRLFPHSCQLLNLFE